MSELFYKLKKFNADVSSWDTSGVTDMQGMFRVRCGPNLHLEPPRTLLRALLHAQALPSPVPHLASLSLSFRPAPHTASV